MQDLLNKFEISKDDSAVCDFYQFLEIAIAYLNKWFDFSDDGLGLSHQVIALSLVNRFPRFYELQKVKIEPIS